VSLPDDLYAAIRAEAGGNVSGWLAEAAERQLKRTRLIALVDEWLEESGGPMTDEEIRETDEWLGFSSTPER